MGRQSPILAFMPAMPKGIDPRVRDRRPTEAEREFVRAQARAAAQAIFDAERRATPGTPDEVSS
jgi:hypothetical protein